MLHILLYVLNLEIKDVFPTYSAPQFGQATFQVFLPLSSRHVGWCEPGGSWEKDKRPLSSDSHTVAVLLRATVGVSAKAETIKFWELYTQGQKG